MAKWSLGSSRQNARRSRVPGAAQHEVVRCRPGTVPVRGDPGSAVHRSTSLRAAPRPGHAIPPVIPHSCLTTSNNTHSLVAARFCVNALSPQHALAGPIPVFSCFSADSDLPSRVLRSQTTRTPPFQHALPPSNTHSLLPTPTPPFHASLPPYTPHPHSA